MRACVCVSLLRERNITYEMAIDAPLVKAAVCGAGVMGSAIAAHLASYGIQTLLLDLPSEKGDRNAMAAKGLLAAKNARPPSFRSPDAIQYISLGNYEDDLEKLRDRQLIIEAVVEDSTSKQKVFSTIAPYVSAEAILASNTSALPLASFTSKLEESVQSRCLAMHFFKPVALMNLIEIAPGPKTAPAHLSQAGRYARSLGKGVIFAKPVPSLIANRLGMYMTLKAAELMEKYDFTIDQVDAITGTCMGRPLMATFGNVDFVGLDICLKVADTCAKNLPDEEERKLFVAPAWMREMAERDHVGVKGVGGSGIYKNNGSSTLVTNYRSLEYQPTTALGPRSRELISALSLIENQNTRIRTLLTTEFECPASKFAWELTANILCYVANNVDRMASDIVSIDRAMRWGFNHQLGPFQMWDLLGVKATCDRLAKCGFDVPPKVTEMLQRGHTKFYSDDGKEYYDICSGLTVSMP